MAERPRIKTPWKHQWQRVRFQVVPVLTVLICAGLAGWLWNRHVSSAPIVGAVQLVQVNVTSPIAGRLAESEETNFVLFQQVEKGQIVARLEDGALAASAEIVQAEINRLNGEINERSKSQSHEGLMALRSAVAVQEARLREIEVQRKALEIRAPIAGLVSQILRISGQGVLAGEPIVQITEEEPPYIVSYIRQDQRVRPAAGGTVVVRDRNQRNMGVQTRIARVGEHNELIPPRQLRNVSIPEWGRPVLIDRPLNSGFRPGELVDVIFERQ